MIVMFTYLNSVCDRLRERVAERDELIASLDASIAAGDTSIALRDQVIILQNKAMERQDERIVQLERENEFLGRRVGELEWERDLLEEIKMLHIDTIRMLDSNLTRAEGIIADREEVIFSLGETLTEATVSIEEDTGAILSQGRRIHELGVQLSACQAGDDRRKIRFWQRDSVPSPLTPKVPVSQANDAVCMLH